MTGRIIGYGEDPLTYWALTTRLGDVLRQLHDPAPPESALLFYRPSFGRHIRAKDPKDAHGPWAEFGEFDAILGTHEATYLIASKWTSSGEARGESLGLREEQTHRHRILRWYLETWRGSRPASWSAFVTEHDRIFRIRFPGHKMAPHGSVLAQNLEFVIRRLDRCGGRVREVLLQIGCAGPTVHAAAPPSGFALVTIEYTPLDPSSFFEMSWTPEDGR
jgi:hypothetical protein